MRYDFQCAECGAIEEHVFRMADKPDHVTCGCGGRAESIISPNIEVLIQGNERPMELNATSVPIGWDKGNTDGAAQQARYSKIIETNRKQAKSVEKTAIKNGLRMIGQVPRELFRLRQNQYGKDYYQTDVKQKLKSDGLLYGE